MSSFVEIVNSFTKKICFRNNLICFNLHENIIFEDEKDFYDGIHTTPKGSEKVGRVIGNFINKIID